MHILLGILSALGVVAYFVIRASYVAQAARELGETASDVKGLIRRSRWRRKTKADMIREIVEPRLAAIVMMCAMAKEEGDLTEKHKDAILSGMRDTLEFDDQAAQELLVQARWITSEMKDLSAFLQRASKPIAEKCTEQEKADLLDMLSAVAAAESELSEIQRDALDRLRLELGLPRP